MDMAAAGADDSLQDQAATDGSMVDIAVLYEHKSAKIHDLAKKLGDKIEAMKEKQEDDVPLDEVVKPSLP